MQYLPSSIHPRSSPNLTVHVTTSHHLPSWASQHKPRTTMAATTKPTLLLIQGSRHYPSSYTKLTTALCSAGFEVHSPCNTGASINQTRPPNADLYTNSNLIRAYTISLMKAGRSIAILMHSHGGQIGTNDLNGLNAKTRATERLPEGITHLIYLEPSAHRSLQP